MCRRSLFTVERTADDFPETVKRAQSGERELTYLLPPGSETLGIGRISHNLLQIKQTHLILKALIESFQNH